MRVYSHYFLSFVRGLIWQWLQADAFLFHTRLVRIAEIVERRRRDVRQDEPAGAPASLATARAAGS